MKARTFTASLKTLHEMLQWIRQEASQVGFSSFQLYQIELASEEAIVNVIEHSYHQENGEVVITIAIDPGQIQIEMADHGKMFNPLIHYHQKNKTDSIDEKELGGLGLGYIHKCMDEIRYHRKNDRNVLTMIKKKSTNH